MNGVRKAQTSPARSRFRDEDLPGYLFMAPWILGFLLFTLGPTLASLGLAFTKFDLLSPPQWIGVDNFTFMFTQDQRFWNALRVTFVYLLLEVPLKLAFALAIAMAMDKGIRGGDLYRALFYVPSLLGGSVAIAVLWRQLFQGDGVVNQVLLWLFGVQGPSWISNPETSLYTLVILAVWQFGSPMIIFLAGLRQIPAELYEAASIDGATRWKQFWRITLPLLAPVLFFNIVFQTIEAFKAFTPAFIISGGTGGPVDSTLFYTLYLYQEAFAHFRMGYASALAWVLLVIIGVCTTLSFLASKYWVFYEDER
ncbi:MAG: ABC transporter permease [Rhizobiales bacterium 65-9]|nr:sugar ABC transporter permease [Hyphomicrobiales bacterium]OJY35019.1 MAG: ABC transporter permease [Rhizobiales bacterium 65-9]